MANFVPVFIDGLDPSASVQKPKGHSKLFHRKSRTGCQRCRTRRVKCNETKPVCRNCARLGHICIYDRQAPDSGYHAKPDQAAEEGSRGSIRSRTTSPGTTVTTASTTATATSAASSTTASYKSSIARQEPGAQSATSGPSNAGSSSSNSGGSRSRSPSLAEEGEQEEDEDAHEHEPPETRRRRMLELELMHFYVTETGPSTPFDKGVSYDMFVKAVPRMALKSDGLLYTVLAYAALHQTKTTGGGDPSVPSPASAAAAREHHELYMRLAVQHHQQELARLSRANADAVCVTANLIRTIALVVLSERCLVPYVPPVEWLRVTRSHTGIFRTAWDLLHSDGTTMSAMMLRQASALWENNERHRAAGTVSWHHREKCLDRILLPQPDAASGCDDDDPTGWDDGERKAYESAVGYAGGMWRAMPDSEQIGAIARQAVLFPLLINKGFIELVAQGRPRALVVLAYLFAPLVVMEPFWYVGDTGCREVRAIAAHLTPHPEWREFMEWPLRVVEEGLSCLRNAPCDDDDDNNVLRRHP